MSRDSGVANCETVPTDATGVVTVEKNPSDGTAYEAPEICDIDTGDDAEFAVSPGPSVSKPG